MTDQKIRDRLLGGVRMWGGKYDDFQVPDEICAQVKEWGNDGWPVENDPGRSAYVAWVNAVARAEMGL
jgi:hypothetical protein